MQVLVIPLVCLSELVDKILLLKIIHHDYKIQRTQAVTRLMLSPSGQLSQCQKATQCAGGQRHKQCYPSVTSTNTVSTSQAKGVVHCCNPSKTDMGISVILWRILCLSQQKGIHVWYSYPGQKLLAEVIFSPSGKFITASQLNIMVPNIQVYPETNAIQSFNQRSLFSMKGTGCRDTWLLKLLRINAGSVLSHKPDFFKIYFLFT